MPAPLRIGTRASPLALWQARHVSQLLTGVRNRRIEIVEIQTAGDQVRDVPLAAIGGEGVFTKAIQDALLANVADVAVHSLKDLPTVAAPGLVLAAVPERGPTGDALVSRKHLSFAALPQGATLASSSLRRRAQMAHRRPDLKLVDIRGNVDTRLRKLVEQDLDGIILAEAGLKRLGLAADITEVLDASWMLPAVGQGALGLECRAADAATRTCLGQIDHASTHAAVLAERAMLRELGGGCHVPIGAAASVLNDALTIRGAVLSPDGTRRIEAQLAGKTSDADAIGRELAANLLAKGARELLKG
ncbi:MAG: hydroxymethylbilane synthase [Planctomycetes bacterium]|nr:hydroxymethylbilane synthase [Planctomycetota bacterium]